MVIRFILYRHKRVIPIVYNAEVIIAVLQVQLCTRGVDICHRRKLDIIDFLSRFNFSNDVTLKASCLRTSGRQ